MTQSIESEAPAGRITRPLLLSARQNLTGWLLRAAGQVLFFAVTATSVVAVMVIFVFVGIKAWPFFAQGRLGEMFASTHWHPTSSPESFGMLSMVFGSLFVTGAALLLAVPIGILTAVLLSDIVSFRIRQAIKPVVELLAAIPSVAYGFFAVLVLAPWMQKHLGMPSGTNALNSAIMLAIMAIPTIVSVAEDALWSAGRELREASYACGATRAETLLKVVIPATHNGIMAAVVLGMMRAIGETMLVWMASGNASQIPSPWWDLTQSVRTMTATIAGEMGEAAKDSTHYHSLFAVGLILLTFSMGLNLLTEFLLRRSRHLAGGQS